jgi:hypothetical protein
MGWKLHDGVIQSVYAVGMKLEIRRVQFLMTPEQKRSNHAIIIF